MGGVEEGEVVAGSWEGWEEGGVEGREGWGEGWGLVARMVHWGNRGCPRGVGGVEEGEGDALVGWEEMAGLEEGLEELVEASGETSWRQPEEAFSLVGEASFSLLVGEEAPCASLAEGFFSWCRELHQQR